MKLKPADLIGDYSEKLRPQALKLAEHVLFMADTLDELRSKIEGGELVTDGGKMRHESAELKAYDNLMSRYVQALSQLESMTGQKIRSKDATKDAPKSKLEDFRLKSRAALKAV